MHHHLAAASTTAPLVMHRGIAVARRVFSSPITNHPKLSCRLFAAKPSLIVAQAASTGGAGEQGQITAALMASMRSKISQALETENVSVVDTSGDGRHVAIDVVSPAFEGLNAVKRQRLVYKAIWEELQEAVHAVDSMTTKTPDEAGSA